MRGMRRTLATGARQFVVHEAFDTTSISAVYLLWLTPITNIGASPEGALMTTCGRPHGENTDMNHVQNTRTVKRKNKLWSSR